MSAAWVAKAVDVLKEGDFDVAAGLPVCAPNQFGLYGFEEALDRQVLLQAGVDPARVRQFYTSKDALFAASLSLSDAVQHCIAAAFNGSGDRRNRASYQRSLALTRGIPKRADL